MTETTLSKSKADVVSLTIDGKKIEVERGISVLEAARRSHIYIPHLCDHPSIKPYAGCRLCLVEIEGQRGFDTSCTVPVADGMVVRTSLPEIRERQRDVLEIILSDHPDRCLNCWRFERCGPSYVCQRDEVVGDRCVVCPKNKQCQLQTVVDFLDLRSQRYDFMPRRSSEPEHSNPFIERNADYCIYCTRCVRVCEEVRGIGALGPGNRGPHDEILVPFDPPLTETNCEFCGQCALVCPTGAIVKLDSRHGRFSNTAITTTCGHCAVGCGLNLKIKDGHIINVQPQQTNPVAQGRLCVKGHFGYDYVESEDRLREPIIREGGVTKAVSWDEALDKVASGLLAIKNAHGADSIGFVGSVKATNEENYLVQKLAREVIGTSAIDNIGRLLYTPALEAMRAAFGVAGATNPIKDVDKSGCLMVVGANVTETHTVLGLQIKQAVRRNAKLILIDPREVPLTAFATLWLRPRPGTDAILLNGILKAIFDADLADEAYLVQNADGLDALKASLAPYDLATVTELTGVPAEHITSAAAMLARGGDVKDTTKPLAAQQKLTIATAKPAAHATSIFFGAGAIQQANATEAIAALIDLALVTGSIGKTGGGLFPLAGENNTLGAAEMGALAEYLPGLRPAEKPGLTLLEMIEAARQGQIKALYVLGTDLLTALPDAAWVAEALGKLELLVVQDLFPTATTSLGHVILPGTSFAEREGTFTNLERRVQRIRKAIEPVGQSRPDWQILCDLGDRLLAAQGQLNGQNFAYIHPSHVMEEIGRVAPSYAGVDYERAGGYQHPEVVAIDSAVARARLTPASKPAAPAKASGYPLTLTTGGLLYHQGHGTMSRHSRSLTEMVGEAMLEMSQADAEAAGITNGSVAKVTSASGAVQIKVRVTDTVPTGMVFLPAFDNQVAALVARPADLTAMPAFKHTPVKVEKVG